MEVIEKISLKRCAVCGIPFGVPESFLDVVRKDSSTLYCPRGHSLRLTNPKYNDDDVWKDECEALKTENQKLKHRLTKSIDNVINFQTKTKEHEDQAG